MVLEPEAMEAITSQSHNDHMNQEPTDRNLGRFFLDGFFLSLPIAVHQREAYQRGYQDIIGNIEIRQFLINDKQWQARPPDVLDVCLTEHIIIIEQWPEIIILILPKPNLFLILI